MTAALVAERLDSNSYNHAIATRTGKAFSIFDAESWEFDLDDIIPALSNITRFNGQTDFYSVAEHCCRVASYMRRHVVPQMGLTPWAAARAEMAALLHDATEAYMGDVPRPQKHKTSLDGAPFSDIEDLMNIAIMEHFGVLDDDTDALWEQIWAGVKESDYAVYLMERDERPTPAMGSSALTPTQAEDVYRAWFAMLSGKMKVG